jgi:hypothetical protein
MLENGCGVLPRLVCDEEGSHISLFKESRTDTDMEDKEEVCQWKRRRSMRRWKRLHTRRWVERWMSNGTCLCNALIYLATW